LIPAAGSVTLALFPPPRPNSSSSPTESADASSTSSRDAARRSPRFDLKSPAPAAAPALFFSGALCFSGDAARGGTLHDMLEQLFRAALSGCNCSGVTQGDARHTAFDCALS
jgi:hypothetical protein